MMTLDEMEMMCRAEMADEITGTTQRDYRGSMRAYHLARALLAVLPVVRAAEECIDKADADRFAIWLDSSAGMRLVSAIDSLRKSQEAK